MRVAVIDVGSSSVKLHLAERDGLGRWRPVLDRLAVTRLGEGLGESAKEGPGGRAEEPADGAPVVADAQAGESGGPQGVRPGSGRAAGPRLGLRLGSEARARTLAAIADLAGEARAAGARRILAVGTLALRRAENGADFLAAVRAACGVAIRVLDADDEARLAWLGVRAGLPLPGGPVAVFDSGGGSTQVTLGRGERVLGRLSLDLGAVALTERFGLAGVVPRAALSAVRSAIDAGLAPLGGLLDACVAPDKPPEAPQALVGTGGAVACLAAVALGLDRFDPERLHGARLDRDEVERQIRLYAERPAPERVAIAGLPPERADIVLAGGLIVRALMERLGQEHLTASDRGLRHGVLVEGFSDLPFTSRRAPE